MTTPTGDNPDTINDFNTHSDEAAVLLGCSASSVLRYIHEGHLRAVRRPPLRRYLISRSSIDAILNGGTDVQ